MARVVCILVGLGLLVSDRASAVDARQVEMCPLAKGLSAEVTGQFLAVLLEVGKSHGVGLAPQACCPDPACLRAAAFERKVTGVVLVELLRFGPTVRISLRAVDTKTGSDLLQVKASAPAKGFPASATALRTDLRRCLAALGAKRRISSTDPEPKPKPNPKPKQDPVLALALGPEQADPSNGWVNPQPGPVMSDADAAVIVSRRATFNWTGGGLMAGGGVMLAVGIGLLAGPFRNAMDERDRAYAAWVGANDTVLRDALFREMKDQDEAANAYHTAGWVGVGLGTGVAVAGLVLMLLAPELPEDAPLARVGASLQPTIGSDGGGAVLRWSW